MSIHILPPIEGVYKNRRVMIWNNGDVNGRMIYKDGDERHEFIVTGRTTGPISRVWRMERLIGLVRISYHVELNGYLTCDCEEFAKVQPHHQAHTCIHVKMIFLFRLYGLIK